MRSIFVTSFIAAGWIEMFSAWILLALPESGESCSISLLLTILMDV